MRTVNDEDSNNTISSLLLSREFLIVSATLAIIFAAVARIYLTRYSISATAAACIYMAFALQLMLSLAPAFHRHVRATAILGGGYRVLAVVPVWCVPYLLYAAGTGDFRWLALLKLVSLAVLPTVVYSRFPPRNPAAFGWQDGFVALTLIGAVLSGQLRGIWNVPVNLDFMTRLFLITLASWCWTFIRVVPALGYSLRISRSVLTEAILNFILFAAIAIPSSLAIHFTRWNPQWPGVVGFVLNYLEMFLFIALLEELFFRGFLQNLLSTTLRSWVAAQVLVSVLFGLFHILHPPVPNWRYVALACVAGWFYGSAYRRTGSLMASSLLHAAVDTVWRTWLSAR